MDVTPGAPEVPSAHPLAYELAERLRPNATTREIERILLVGIGSGRNVAPFVAADLRVDVVEADPARALAATNQFAAERRVRVSRARYAGPLPFTGDHAGALSTHALLHGTLGAIAASIAAVRNRLGPGAPFYATLGSTNDPRFGAGERLAENTFVPLDGDEVGVAHSYVDAAGARALFAGLVVESLEEVRGGEHVGRWAHGASEAATIVHWYVRARTARADERARFDQ